MSGKLIAKGLQKAVAGLAIAEGAIQAGERALKTGKDIIETGEKMEAARKQGDRNIEKAVKDIRDGN